MFLVGCTSEHTCNSDVTPPVVQESKTISISTDCDIDIISDTILALNEWFDRAPHLKRDIMLTSEQSTIRCEWPDELGNELGGTTRNGIIRLNIEVLRAKDSDIRVVALHELGHLFGAKHLQEGNVMAVHYRDTVSNLTDADVASLRIRK